jgi:hypothetical protein
MIQPVTRFDYLGRRPEPFLTALEIRPRQAQAPDFIGDLGPKSIIVF